MVRFSRGMLKAAYFQFVHAISELDEAEALFLQRAGGMVGLQTTAGCERRRWHLGRLRRPQRRTRLFRRGRRAATISLSNMLGAMHPYLSLALGLVDKRRATGRLTLESLRFHYQHLGLQWCG